MSSQPIWRSNPIRITDDTVVEVSAGPQGITIEQNGEAWLQDLHLTPQQARLIAAALISGADESERAGGAS